MLRPKKYSCKEFDNKKKFLRLKNSPPPRPHNFSNGPSLTVYKKIVRNCPIKKQQRLSFPDFSNSWNFFFILSNTKCCLTIKKKYFTNFEAIKVPLIASVYLYNLKLFLYGNLILWCQLRQHLAVLHQGKMNKICRFCEFLYGSPT